VEHEPEVNENEEEQPIPKNERGIEYSGPLGRVKAFSICLLTKVRHNLYIFFLIQSENAKSSYQLEFLQN
jgi:hypothetical protein